MGGQNVRISTGKLPGGTADSQKMSLVGLSMGGQNAKISIGKLPGGTADSQKMSLEWASVWVARV